MTTYEIPDEPTAIDRAWTHNADTGEPMEWTRTSGLHRLWSPVDGGGSFTWTQMLEHGPVFDVHPDTIMTTAAPSPTSYLPPGPALVYAHSDRSTVSVLDQIPDNSPWLPHREAVLAVALLRFALSRLTGGQS